MKRRELETALRAAATLSGESEFFLLGSQAVHGSCRRPPAEVLLSQECDLYPKGSPLAGDVLATKLGRGSRFARAHGFYVDIVSPEIANLPTGWELRVQHLTVGPVTALCLEINDLVLSKLSAGRVKDFEFVSALVRRKLVRPATIRRRIRLLQDRLDQRQVRFRFETVLNELSRR